MHDLSPSASGSDAWWHALSLVDIPALDHLVRNEQVDPAAVNALHRNAIGEALANTRLDHGATLTLVEWLLKAGCPIDATHPRSQPALTIAAAHRQVAVFLVQVGARIDLVRQHDQRTLLINAVKSGHVPLVHALVDRGVDLDAADENGDTAALHAARRADLSLLLHLADAGASLSHQNQAHQSVWTIIADRPGMLGLLQDATLQHPPVT